MSVKTAIGYVRISRDPNQIHAGIDRQIEDVRALAAELGTDLGTIFEDASLSAFSKRKPVTGWGRALTAIERDRPNFLLVFKTDRLGRRLSDIEGLEELCRSTGTKVISKVEGEVFANPAWPILVAVAKMESMNTSLRIRRSQDSRRDKGLAVNGGTRPFGFESDRVTVVEREAELIREMAHRILDGGSIRSCVEMLKQQAVPTVQGGTWNVDRVGAIIRNPRYAGLNRSKGKVIGKGNWPRIITEMTFNQVQAALAVNDREQGPRRTTLLGGLIFCGLCQERMDSNGVGGYRCSSGGHVTRAMSILDPYVTDWTINHFSDDLVREDIRRATEKEQALQTEMLKLNSDIDSITQAWQSGEVPETKAFLQGLTALRRRRDRLVAEYFDAKVALDSAMSSGQAKENWEDWTIAEKRKWLSQRIDHITVSPSGRGVRILDPKTVKIYPRKE